MSDTDSGITTDQQRKSGIRNDVTFSLPGVHGRSALGRVQGDNACADAREGLARSPEAERPGPVKC